MVQRGILWTVTASVLILPMRAQGNFVPVVNTSYAPPEVSGPHAAHKLTLFLPRACPPEDTGLYPVLLYSPASMFAATATAPGSATESVASLETGMGEFEPLEVIEVPGGGGGNPGPRGLFRCTGFCSSSHSSAPAPPPSQGLGFLAQALSSGWAVVTVGTTGWNSWPTCAQLEDCNPCNLGAKPSCGASSGCWDTNLWYAPGSTEWNDFNRFWGEKEFLWARQWVGQNAAVHGLDNGRVVVCGTSTGAIYASFLAFGPNRAWDATHSPQAQQDTRVAGIVAFEPNTWIKALGNYWAGVHWPSTEDPGVLCGSTGTSCYGSATCHNRRAVSLGLDTPVAPGVLEQSSISRWVREIEDESESHTPAFIATGDGFLTTDFLRDANTFTSDYDRYAGESGAMIPGDPLLSFTAGPELALHDSWYAMSFALDLAMLDEANGDTFHEDNSRLFLQEGHTWSNLPDWLSTTGLPPQAAEEVLGLDGTYAYQTVQSIDNTDLAPQVVAWMEDVLDIQRAGVTESRNPPLVGPASATNINPSIYTSPPVVKGEPTEVEVDLNGAPGYEVASVLIFSSASAPGTELVLSGGQALLCDIGSYLMSTPFAAKDLDGVARPTLGAASPACITFSTQAILADVQHVMPFALTNAVDITVQP